MFVAAGVAFADWGPGDSSLFYQLPDPAGWIVYSEYGTGPIHEPPESYGVANDWTATESAVITNIHFWGSWKDGVVGQSGEILVQIFSNDTGDYDPAFPRPDKCLWSVVLTEDEYTNQLYSTGDMGWYDPRYFDEWNLHNEDEIYEYSIPFLEEPFEQEAGETYWLSISMNAEEGEWGWLTSLDIQGNDSVFWDSYDFWAPHPTWSRRRDITWKWTPLETPTGFGDYRIPMDLAFVIIPEPAALLLLAAGAAFGLRKTKR
jgi:hypothetical protein